jgi:hypothetical protein
MQDGAVTLLALLLPGIAAAESIVPGPADPGFDSALQAKADGYNVELHTFMTLPLGWGLEAFVGDAQHRALISDFFDAGATDFQAFSGKHPYEVLDDYAEEGDLGMFGGVQAAGDAFRYAVLRDSGAPKPQVDAARAALLRAMNGLHWYTQVTGVPGLTARGLRRVIPEAGDPALPGSPPMTVPLFDDAGQPQPNPKDGEWREDRSGALPFLVWHDDTSKDQLDGYVFALGIVYDVTKGDATVSPDLVATLSADALALGQQLMKNVEVAPGQSTDLVIVDPDGRPTAFHDLSAEEFSPGAVSPDALNGFNALLALSIMRTLFHITGDDTLGHYYYDELLAKRRYLNAMKNTVSLMYTGTSTNYSNVNMAFVAVYGLLRYETDPTLARHYREILESNLYRPGLSRQAAGLGESFFDFIYAGFEDGGQTAIAQGLATLSQFPKAPWWDDAVTNCDAAEVASLSCTASDGSPLQLESSTGHGGDPVATEPLPMRLRPPSNFEWRDDPFNVNGGGSTVLNPGGDFHAAYWMGRFLKANGSNVSPLARPPPGTTQPTPPPVMKPGCGCASSAPYGLGLLVWVSGRRVRRAPRRW